MVFYLGVDGGGSGCRAAVCDPSGRVLGRGSGGAANIWTDPPGAQASIMAAASGALDAAGLAGRFAEVDAVLGLAGANVPEAAERLRRQLPFRRVRVETDALIALKGALGAADGIVAALGTGSVFGAQRGGRVETIGGWGFLLGDQASGAWIGRGLLREALLAHDGVTVATPILSEVVAEAGGPAALVARATEYVPGDFARYVPRILAAAAQGDAAAETVLAAADAAIAAAVARLQAGGALPIAFIGGLGDVFAARLAGRYGDLIRPPAGTPLDGALALARGAA